MAAAAKPENRALLTLGVEFVNLAQYPPGNHPGIILFWPRTFAPLPMPNSSPPGSALQRCFQQLEAEIARRIEEAKLVA